GRECRSESSVISETLWRIYSSRRWRVGRTVMAVYELTYKQFLGKLTPEWNRFMVIPRHAFRDVFKSKLFTAFFVICFVPLLVEAILIYLHHNVSALAIMK